MRGVILAGGTGSRLRPLTKAVNKHLLPVADKPMVYYPIEMLLSFGLQEILVVTGTEHMGTIVTQLGSGVAFGARFTYRVQDEAGGIAQALALAEDYAHGEPVAVVLGDNIYDADMKDAVSAFRARGTGAHIFLKQVSDPHRFGVAEVAPDGRVLSIEEKPAQPRSSYAVTGFYLYDGAVFDCIRTLKPSGRGELEITDVNNHYIHQGTLTATAIDGWWSDAGTVESLARANDYWNHKLGRSGATPGAGA